MCSAGIVPGLTEVELKERGEKKWLFSELNLSPLTLKPGSQ